MVFKQSNNTRTYIRKDCAVFLKTKEGFGGLSNMAGGYPVKINGIHIRSSEALYQACRFPHLPKVQEIILQQTSPMTAKMKSKPFRKDSRSDWDKVRVAIMRWSLRVKLAHNMDSFGRLLLATKEKPIVEESRKDSYWGAKPKEETILVGQNVLGRLLMELREELKQLPQGDFSKVNSPRIDNFLLLDRPIGPISVLVEEQNFKEAVSGTAQRNLF